MENSRLQRVTFRAPHLSLLLLYSIMPIVSRLISQTVTTYFYMFVVLWTVFLIVFYRKEESINKYLPVLLPFMLSSVLSYINNNDSIIMWGYREVLSYLPIIMGFHIIYERPRDVDFFGKLIFVAIMITMVTTIIGLIRFPGASRILATVSSNQAESIQYDWNNIGGYEFIYIVVLLYPLLILASKKRKINLTLTIICTVLIFTTVILSEYTTALLFILLSSALWFLKPNVSGKGILILSILGILFIIIFWDLVANLLDWVGDLIGSEVMSERLDIIIKGDEGQAVSEDNRLELYGISLSTFFNHPIFGTLFLNWSGSGYHSAILDTLATRGIVGGFALYLQYKISYTNFLQPYSNRDGFGFVMWFFIQAILLAIVNTGTWISILTLYGAIFINMIFREKKE